MDNARRSIPSNSRDTCTTVYTRRWAGETKSAVRVLRGGGREGGGDTGEAAFVSRGSACTNLTIETFLASSVRRIVENIRKSWENYSWKRWMELSIFPDGISRERIRIRFFGEKILNRNCLSNDLLDVKWIRDMTRFESYIFPFRGINSKLKLMKDNYSYL